MLTLSSVLTSIIAHYLRIEDFFLLKIAQVRYYCQTYTGFLATYWFNEEDIRPVNEEEADDAIDWITAAQISNIMEIEESREEREQIYEFEETSLDDRPKCIDLFAGAGGLTLGMAWAGFNVVGHVEHSKECNETYDFNKENCGFGNSELIGKDITQVSDEQIKDFKKKHDQIHAIVGGPPCQGFSTAGKRDPKDPRNSLFMHFIRFCKIVKPTTFLMENVPGMKSMKTAKGELSMDIILQQFQSS